MSAVKSKLSPNSRNRSTAISKNAKNRRKIIAKKIKSHKMGLIILLSISVIVILMSVNLLNNMGKIKNKGEQITAMENERNHRRIQNDALQQKVDDPTDDEYIIEFARRNGYRKSDEIIFYLTDGD